MIACTQKKSRQSSSFYHLDLKITYFSHTMICLSSFQMEFVFLLLGEFAISE